MANSRSAPSALGQAEANVQRLRPMLAPRMRALQARDGATVTTQIRLAQLAAPTGAEGARATMVADAFRLRGFSSVALDAAGNVIVRRPSDAPHLAPVVCVAHLDTVFPTEMPLAVREELGRIHCPGIGDNARGLAGMLVLADVLGIPGLDGDAAPLVRPIEYVATVGEEGLGNLRGARHYFDSLAARGVAPHAVIALDGPGDQGIVHHALGSRRYRISFTGAGGHSWTDFGAPNAIHAAGFTIARLTELPAEFRQRITLTVSGIGGGESVNAIPGRAWLDVDIRGTDDLLLQRADLRLREITASAVARESGRPGDQPLRPTVQLLGDRPAGTLDAAHPLVATAMVATRAAGREPLAAIASTDANIPLARGLPAITIGAGGRGGGAHTPDEWYENADGVRGLERALTILAAMAA